MSGSGPPNPEPISFDGQVAVVTGAGNGLGRAYAIGLAARGARVVCNDIVAAAAAATAATIERAGDTAVPETSSVATPEGGASIVQAAVDAFGAVDIVVNNAGQLRNAAFDEMSPEEFTDVVQTHLGGAFHVTQPAFRHMKRAGYGRIVFTSSSAGLFGSPGQANYAAAKAGLLGLCNVVALEGAPHGITANAIMPMALTGIGDGARPPFPPEVHRETVRALRPLLPSMTVEHVVPLVLYLSSRHCTVTKRIFSVGCGHVAEAFAGVTRGWCAPDLSESAPDEVAAHLDAVCDRDGSATPGSMNEATRWVAERLAGRSSDPN